MLKTIPAKAPLSDFLDALDQDGGVIVSDILESNVIDNLVQDFEPHLDRAKWGDSDSDEPDEFFGLTTKRLHGLISKSHHVEGLVTHPLLHDIARSRLGIGDRAFDFRISTTELMVIGPGEKRQPLHRDGDAWHFAPLGSPRPEILLSANFALDDFTKDNGATVVVPGSHKWHKDRKAEPHEMCQAVMKRGSALVYSGEIVHSGGQNLTQQVRRGLYVGFLASWLRPSENHLHSNDPAVINALPQEIQKLFDVIPSGFSLII